MKVKILEDGYINIDSKILLIVVAAIATWIGGSTLAGYQFNEMRKTVATSTTEIQNLKSEVRDMKQAMQWFHRELGTAPVGPPLDFRRGVDRVLGTNGDEDDSP
jgi:hypothetical protein